MSQVPASPERPDSSRARLQSRLDRLGPRLLRQLNRGIEKESLRALPDGRLALTPHPAGLGSAMTHPSITTDFSESQVELITGVHQDINDCLQELTELHQITLAEMGEDLLWASSMPCRLPAEHEIPIGQYGSSNVGRTKTVYRTGLSHRYGRRMQTISGLHYNFSLPPAAWPRLQCEVPGTRSPDAARNAGYFALIRNFRRDSWLLTILFGASPAVEKAFVDGADHRLEPLGETVLHRRLATSLRMGPLGYQSDAQSRLGVSYNCLPSYATSLREALTQPYPAYEAIGITDAEGNYRQLSTTLLQIENEFYGTIRPKQPVQRGERPLSALARRGVAYVEVRLMDLDPFSAIGIEAETIRFLDIFLLHCLLSDSPPDSPESIERLSQNRHRVAQQGRDPALQLQRDDGSTVLASDWAEQLLTACEPVAAALDAAWPEAEGAYAAALAMARRRIEDLDSTPSARLLAALQAMPSPTTIDLVRQLSDANRRQLRALPLPDPMRERYEEVARHSIEAQRFEEAADTLPFEAWRQQYLHLPLVSGLTAEAASPPC